jgi:fluoride exporter
MVRILLVGLGGALGSISRFLLAGFVQRLGNGSFYPYGTTAVNILGCLAIGLLAGLHETHGYFTAEARAFLMIGILGGFTTFSTFGYETFQLLRDGQSGVAAVNVLVQVITGLAAVWAGFTLAKLV